MSHLGLVRRWEDLGKQLEKTIAAYVEACVMLDSCSLVVPACARDLASRIDTRLNSFSTHLSGPLISALCSISRTRNKLVTLVLRLPDEILSEIFRLATRCIDTEEPDQMSCRFKIRAMYQRLHTLAGVCSAWRRIGLESDVWTLVPVMKYVPGGYTCTAARLSLDRAANRRLHFAALHAPRRPDVNDFIAKTLTLYGSRFDSINLHSRSFEFISKSLSTLLETVAGSQRSINHLALFHSKSLDLRSITYFPVSQEFVGELVSPAAYKQIMESLQVLRIRGLNLSFEGISLRNLTEVKLQGLVLESKLRLSQFLKALGTSSQLRTLEIMSVLFAARPGDYSHEGFPISLPSLQHLYLEDLSLDALRFILGSITPGSYLVTLNWSNRCSHEVGDQRISNRFFQRGLKRYKIDALMFRPERGGTTTTTFTPGLAIYFALKTIPTLTALYLDSFVLQSNNLRNLIPMPELESQYREKGIPVDLFPFPKLKKLYISRSHCHDLAMLRDLPEVVAYHELEELGIGIGMDCTCERSDSAIPGPHDQADIESELARVWQSMGESAPRLIRLPGNASEMPPVPNFESQIWTL